MAAVRALKIVGDQAEPTKPRADLYAYESEQRAAIARVDWAAVHVRGDRRAPIALFGTTKRGWRG